MPQNGKRAELLRAIERLRVGLPPSTAASRLSIGTDRLASALSGFLSSGGNGGLFITGDYGTGKSHSLMLLRDLALDQGYATCWLTADGHESALNHPQRFFASLLSTLETPRGDSGYSALIARMLATPEEHGAFIDAVLLALQGSSNIELAIRYHVGNLRDTSDGSGGGESAHLTADAVASLLSGETLTGLGNLENYRRSAYRLLGAAERVVAAAGCRGLVIIVDEVESIFTKLWNIRSRLGAYRVLSALCMGMGDATVKVAMAVTPDASRAFTSEITHALQLVPSTAHEPLGWFCGAILSRTIPVLRCHSLTAAELGELLSRIKNLYCETYPGTSVGSSSEWTAVVRSILRRNPSVRIAVRDAIDALDRNRLRTDGRH